MGDRRPNAKDPVTQALRMLEYGLTVVTGRAGDAVAGGTCNWLTQASFSPPLVVAAIKSRSLLHALVSEGGAFCVNLLAEGQEDLARAFFRPSRHEGAVLNGHPFRDGAETSCPVIEGCPAHFECRVVDVVARGDYTIFVGEVVSAGASDPHARPLALRPTGWVHGG
ncbi:flavin reductase family protein [Myxococcota bacterium]|nr:flavin reductase family protein [Myxococcota bacterium]